MNHYKLKFRLFGALLLLCCALNLPAEVQVVVDRLGPFHLNSAQETDELGLRKLRLASDRFLKEKELNNFELRSVRMFDLGMADYWAVEFSYDYLGGKLPQSLTLYSDLELSKSYSKAEFEEIVKIARNKAAGSLGIPGK